MRLSELQVGTKLELEFMNEMDIRFDQTLVSEFEWAIGDNAAMIAAPIIEGVVFPIHAGAELYAYFLLKKERDINLFRFRGVVKGRGMSDNIALLKVEAASEIEKVQRRQYYRLECSVPVQYRIIDSMNPVITTGVPFKKTIASNLSGGGICLLLEDRVELGKLVECEMLTGEDKTVRFFGKIVRYERSEVEGRFKFEAGIAYIKINDNDREAVVRFIFDEQRKLRKKGLI